MHGFSTTAAIVRILVYYFDYDIDNLEPETSISLGPLPIFIEDTDTIAFVDTLSNHHEIKSLGADQVIIVREDEARERLHEQDEFFRNCQIVTVLECKGLEFDDV